MTTLRDYVASARQPALASQTARYDEVVDGSGHLRTAWRSLAAETDELTLDRLRRARREIGRFLADDGVTYTRPGRGSGASPWRLDPLPVIVEASEWSTVEAGLAQRAELMDRLVRDLYGERRVLSSGVLPAAVVHGHPGYLRALARPGSQERSPLLVTAADLGRTTSGEWRVLADRLQAPSGLGYAMENRRVTSRTLPGLYRQAGLHRMAPYFQALRSTLLAAAPPESRDPRVVVLTPGSRSETAYDQAFLASSLGFPLVQGNDLTVRDGRVWLRVPGRLEQVDVVWRRVDAGSSDPLELDGDSQLGVPGLLEAVRRGTVHVVNGLGTGVLESPALLAYLPRLSEVLLDEPLRLSSRRTLWLGDPAQRRRAADELEALEVRAIDDSSWRPPADRSTLLRAVEAAPHRFVAQEPAQVSQAPTLVGDAVRPAPLAVRAFTIRYGAGYRPLMGGLASVLDVERAVSSKDVWVLKESPDQPDQGLADVMAMTTARAPATMVLRVLDDMFWFGRYAERAESGVRLLLQLHALREEHLVRPRSPGSLAARVLAEIAWSLSPGPDPLAAGAGSGGLADLLTDADRSGSVAQALAGLRDAATGSRDQFSADLWLALATVERGRALVAPDGPERLDEAAAQVLTGVLAVHGVTSNMVRDATWRLIEVGRATERGLQLVRLLQGTVTVRRGFDVDRLVHQAVLGAAESAVTHRRR